MPPIYVHADNSDPKNKVFIASLAGKSAQAAETKMQSTLVKMIGKNAGFTTNKIANPKGYMVVLKVEKLDASNGQTKCEIKGSIERYPPTVTKSGASGTAMVTTAMSGKATASGADEQAIIDCVEAITESLVAKSMPVMTADMTKR